LVIEQKIHEGLFEAGHRFSFILVSCLCAK